MFDKSLLNEKSKIVGIQLDEYQLNQFSTFYHMLIEKNKVMNLTSITDMEEVIVKHFIDSMMLFNVIDINKIETIADMGTGAGFPGIPLKIAFPHLKVTLMDSLAKRLKFLDEVIDELNLNDIQTVHGRAEDIGKNELYREKYDICVSRAVANLSTLCEYCLPVVKENGYFVSYKSGEIEEELKNSEKAISILGGGVAEVKYFDLIDSGIERSFVKIKKQKLTPKKYPRKAGVPSKEPIK